MDPLALPVDVAAHPGVPAPRLVAEVDSGFQQLFDAYFGHLVSRFACVVYTGLVAAVGTRDGCPGSSPRQATRVGLRSAAHSRGSERSARRLSASRARSSAALQVRRQLGVEARAPRRVTGCANAEARRVQELALEAVAPGAAVLGVARRPDGRSRRSGRGSGACGPFRAGRGRACRPDSCSITSKCVRASRSPAPRTARRVRRRRSRPSGRVDRARARVERPLDQRQVLAASTSRALIWREPGRGEPPRSRATTISPEVSLSRRCTIPGARSRRRPARLAEPVDQGRPLCEGAGWTTRPAGLSTTRIVVVLVDDRGSGRAALSGHRRALSLRRGTRQQDQRRPRRRSRRRRG